MRKYTRLAIILTGFVCASCSEECGSGNCICEPCDQCDKPSTDPTDKPDQPGQTAGVACKKSEFIASCDPNGLLVQCEDDVVTVTMCESGLICSKGACQPATETPACGADFVPSCDEIGNQVVCEDGNIVSKPCEGPQICKAGSCVTPEPEPEPKHFVVHSGENAFESDDFTEAQAKIREFAANAPVTVTVHGKIELSAPWKFDDNDAYAHEVTFVGDNAVVTGGKAVTGWTKVHDNVWKAPYTGDVEALYLDGKAMKPAGIEWRWESLDATMLTLASTNPAAGTITLSAANLGPLSTIDLSTLAGATMKFIIEWVEYDLYISSAVKDASGNIVLTMDDPSKQLISATSGNYCKLPGLEGSKFPQLIRIDHVQPLLDEAGEYYADGQDLYYYSTTDPSTNEIVVPVQQGFIHIVGTDEKLAKNITFKNIAFQYGKSTELKKTAFATKQAEQIAPYDQIVAGDYVGTTKSDKQFYIDHADHITFDSCSFTSLMGTAMEINQYGYNITIINNHFEQIGSSGIRVGYLTWGKDHDAVVPDIKQINSITAGQAKVPSGIVIHNNTIKDIGLDYMGAVGILIYFANHVDITQNTLINLPYTAISTGWGWSNDEAKVVPQAHGSIRIQNNYISNFLSTAMDGGCVYNLGVEYAHDAGEPFGLKVSENYCEVMTKHTMVKSIMYMDEGSQNIQINNNVIDVKGDYIDKGVWALDIRSVTMAGHNFKNITAQNNYTNSQGNRLTAMNDNGVSKNISITENNYVKDLSTSAEAMAIKAKAGAQ